MPARPFAVAVAAVLSTVACTAPDGVSGLAAGTPDRASFVVSPPPNDAAAGVESSSASVNAFKAAFVGDPYFVWK